MAGSASNTRYQVVTPQDLSYRAFVWIHRKSGIRFWWDPDKVAWCWVKGDREGFDGFSVDLAHMSKEIKRTFFESVILS